MRTCIFLITSSYFCNCLVCSATRVKEVEELCRGSLESVYSLYPTLSRLQAIGELESIGELFSRYVTRVTLFLISSSFVSSCDFKK